MEINFDELNTFGKQRVKNPEYIDSTFQELPQLEENTEVCLGMVRCHAFLILFYNFYSHKIHIINLEILPSRLNMISNFGI